MSQSFRVLGLLLGSLLFNQASLASTVDWTPFFKPWENACDLSKQDIMLKRMTPNYDSFYKSNTYKDNKLPFKPGTIALPNAYKLFVDSDLKTGFYDINGISSGSTFTKKSSYFDAHFNVVGTYYGMPIKKIGFAGGIANGIYSPYFVIDKPVDEVRRKLRANTKITFEDCEVCDENEDDEAAVGLELYPSQQKANMTDVICDLSN